MLKSCPNLAMAEVEPKGLFPAVFVTPVDSRSRQGHQTGASQVEKMYLRVAEW